MSTPVAHGPLLDGSSTLSRLLFAAKKELQTVALGGSTTAAMNQNEVDSLERDAFEVLILIRSWRNKLAPINRIPAEILGLIPDFWDNHGRDGAAIALTHVCRAWREVFTSRSSLWTDFYCMDAKKTRVYLERSKSSPIKLWLDREDGLFPRDPFLQIPPSALRRLYYLRITTDSEHLQDITDYFSRSAPLLQDLSISAGITDPFLNPVLAATLFDGDLSPLRHLSLYSLHTDLPWRNMANLTTFELGYVVDPRVTVGQFLDFFEGAPSLLTVELIFSTPNSGAQNGRLVSLARLRKLTFYGWEPPSLLLEHLLIPVGTEMKIDLDSNGPRIEDFLPRSLDNLRNFSNFTKIRLHFRTRTVSMQFAGPNGRVLTTTMSAGDDVNSSVTQSLAALDISKTKWLEIVGSEPLSEDFHQVLLSMQNLRTLSLSLCEDLRSFVLALAPIPNSTNQMTCPKLEELTLRTEERFDIETMIEVAAARASAGSPLKSVSIINCGEVVRREGTVELLRHVSYVETSVEVRDVDFGVGEELEYGDGDGSDEEGWEGGSSGDDSNIS